MKTRHRCNLSPTQISIALQNWYATGVGDVVIEALKQRLDYWLPQLFGYYALQIGEISSRIDLLAGSRIKHQIHMDQSIDGADLRGSPEALPFSEDSLDLVLLVHRLEFSDAPHRILREVDRTLIPEGHVVIVGFNPISLYGVSKALFQWQNRMPWCGRFYSIPRVRDWLSLLGFLTVDSYYLAFRPPVQRLGVQKRLAFFARIVEFVLPYFGGVYIVVAQKKLATLTPIRPRWRPRRRLLAGNLTEPSTRGISSVQAG